MRDLILIALVGFLLYKLFEMEKKYQAVGALPSAQSNISNTEVWEWIDYKGRKRQIVVRRNVKLK